MAFTSLASTNSWCTSVSDMDLVAILGRDADESLCVWTIYVGTNSNLGFSRLSGAWVVDHAELGTLHFWPQVVGVICGEPEWAKLSKEFGQPARRIYPVELVNSLDREVVALDERYKLQIVKNEDLVRKKHTKLVAPRWPQVPRLSVTCFDEGAQGSALRADVMEAAWWLKSLCDRWQEIEEIRLARVYMRDAVSAEVRNQPWL